VLERGRLVERGKFEQMKDAGGAFQKLLNAG
jgi:ABC-type multidrug transport system fused ATPase/permease subunit